VGLGVLGAEEGGRVEAARAGGAWTCN